MGAFLAGLALGLPLGAIACFVFFEWIQRGLKDIFNHSPKG